MSILLQVQGITKRFGGLLALNQITFDLPEGQILGSLCFQQTTRKFVSKAGFQSEHNGMY